MNEAYDLVQHLSGRAAVLAVEDVAPTRAWPASTGWYAHAGSSFRRLPQPSNCSEDCVTSCGVAQSSAARIQPEAQHPLAVGL